MTDTLLHGLGLEDCWQGQYTKVKGENVNYLRVIAVNNIHAREKKKRKEKKT